MKTKIFLAGTPYNPNNNLSEFYSKLISDESIDLLHISDEDDLDETARKAPVLEYELARMDRLKILESEVVIIDWDSGIRNAYLYWACVHPNSKIIIVSKTSVNVDIFAAEKVVAVVKPYLLLPTLYSLFSECPKEASQGTPDPTLD